MVSYVCCVNFTQDLITQHTFIMNFDWVNHPYDIIPYLPARLYKFRLWDSQYHKDVLERQHLYFSTPEKLWEVGDKDDCLYPIHFPKTPEEFYSILETMPPEKPWASGMSDDDIRRARWQRARLNTEPELLAEREKEYFDTQNNMLRVLSMTRRYDNEAMWNDSTYGSFEKGFCVGIDPTHLVADLFAKGIDGGLCEYVPRGNPPLKYNSYSKDGSEAAIQMAVRHLHMKYDDFSKEEEYRFVKRYFGQMYPNGINQSDWYLPVPKSAFKEVLVGYRMPDNDVQEIKDTCARHSLAVDFYQAYPDGSGNIEVKRI